MQNYTYEELEAIAIFLQEQNIALIGLVQRLTQRPKWQQHTSFATVLTLQELVNLSQIGNSQDFSGDVA